MIIALIYWHFPAPYGAKHHFHGPKRDDSIIDDVSVQQLSPHHHLESEGKHVKLLQKDNNEDMFTVRTQHEENAN